MSKIYKDNWSSWADVCKDFGADYNTPLAEAEPDAVFAAYETPGYEGDAFVAFRRGEHLFMVEGGHCSCYGLEEQWRPDPMPQAALARMVNDSSYGVMARYRDELAAWLAEQSAA